MAKSARLESRTMLRSENFLIDLAGEGQQNPAKMVFLFDLQEALGDVVYAQLPEVDETVTAGDECGALESVKAASEIYTPVSGTITEKNEKVEAAPALINSSAMEDGWLFKVKLSNAESEVKTLMEEDAYQAYLKTQEDDHWSDGTL